MRIGIDIGGSHIGVGLVDDLGNILIKKEKEISIQDKLNIERKIEETIVKYINEIMSEKQIDEKTIELIGIACPGCVNNGTIVLAVNLGIKNFPIVKILNQYFNIPIYLKNDAKCAAICEKEYGSLKSYSNAIFMTIGTGIGGAVFYQDKLIVPKANEGFEIGHMIIEKNGRPCKCGKNGCFETYASITALKKDVKNALKIQNEITGEELYTYINENISNEKIKNTIDEYISNLAIGISNLINIFEPEAISIGGSFIYYKEVFMKSIKSELRNGNLLYGANIPEILMASAGNDAGIIGASKIKE